MRIRHPNNTALKLWYETHYRGLPVQIQRGPLVEDYLDRLHQTMLKALAAHPRTLAFRADLRLPDWMGVLNEFTHNALIQRFVDSFKSKVSHNRQVARQRLERFHETDVRYAWAREIGMHGKPHYHFAFFLNHDAFHTFGRFEPGLRNLFNYLHEAWASALKIPAQQAYGLVHFAEGGACHLKANDPQSVADFFYVASYLCKAATKQYGNGAHGFGCSRI
ncbi:MAG: transposase [Proteobacteria bacterium]|nr:transposase [Pseudomonadota bacterium]